MSRTANVTLYQSKLVKIQSNVLNSDKDNMVIVPITVPEGPDWSLLRAEDFEITSGEIIIQPYYNGAMQVNRMVEDGTITGDFPIYMQFFTGNTYKEEQAEGMNELIYSGIYTKGTATTGTRATIKGTVYKTVVDTMDKEKMTGKIDASLLSNSKVNLQLGHVALSVRKEDFKVAASSVKKEDPTVQMDKALKAKAPSRKSPNPNAPKQEDYPDTFSEGKLMVEYYCWVMTKLNVEYTRKPTA